MTRAAKGPAPGTKAALVIGSVILHLAIFGLIWFLLPEGEKTVTSSPERTAIPEELVESVRRDVEQRQLEELKIKLSELQNLQTAISGIRESRVERWERLSSTLEEFAPEAAAIIAVSASEAVTSLREFLARESGAWDLYRKAAENPEGGLTAREGTRPAASLASIYEGIRLALAALREQQRLLREKLALGETNTEDLEDLETRVSAAVSSVDTVQEARRAHENAYNTHRTELGRIGSNQRNWDVATANLEKAKTALADTQKALAEAKSTEKAAEQTLANTDPKDKRAHQSAGNALKKSKDQSGRRTRELKQREDSLKKAESQMANREKELNTAKKALSEAASALPETLRELESKRKTFLSELSSLLDQQEKINQTAATGS